MSAEKRSQNFFEKQKLASSPKNIRPQNGFESFSVAARCGYFARMNTDKNETLRTAINGNLVIHPDDSYSNFENERQ